MISSYTEKIFRGKKSYEQTEVEQIYSQSRIREELQLKRDKTEFSTLEKIKEAVKYYGCSINKKWHISTIFTLLFISNILYTWIIMLIENIKENSKENQIKVVLRIGIVLFLSKTVQYFAEKMFKKEISKYSGNLTLIGLKNTINAEDVKINNTDSVKLGHNIAEGAEALEKVAENILFKTPENIIKLICNLITIYCSDESNYKMMFFIFFSSAVCLSLIKVYVYYSSMKYVREMVLSGAERDKIHHEIFDRLPIIKAYQADKGYTNKLKIACNLWINDSIKHKMYLLKGNYIQQILGVIFKALAIVIYLLTTEVSVIKLIVTIKLLMETCDTVEDTSEVLEEMCESLSESEMLLKFLYLTQNNINNKIELHTFSDMVFKNVSYQLDNKEVLGNINFKIKKSEKVLFCGVNGIGKSTLFKMLLNHTEYSGSIEINGIDAKNTLIYDLISYVPQNTILMEGTIMHNIKFYNKNKTDEDVYEVCKEMGLHDHILSLSNGYNTFITKEGKNLNGGLRQKIFYARALMRDAEIYLFDEPCNNLDDFYKNHLMKYLLENTRFKDKTILVIAHDCNQAPLFDKKYCLLESGIVELDTCNNW